MSSRPLPRYQKVKNLIIRRIASGDLGPKDRVPSENELAESMRVSRMTANRALRELTDEGWVERVAGRGTFVAERRARSHLLEVRDIADEIRRRGGMHECTVVEQSRKSAPKRIAEALAVEAGSELFHLRVVHREDGVPIQVEDRHVLAAFAPDCLERDFEQETPSAYLTARSPLTEAEQAIRAQLPDARVARELGIERSEPCLVVTRRTWAGGRPVTVAALWHPGSRYELTGHWLPPGGQRGPADIVTLEAKNR